MSNHKIKKIKDFLKDGDDQFIVILKQYSEEDLGIKIVQRISDDQIFHQGDIVWSDIYQSSFIHKFMEDMIHCLITTIDFDDKQKVKINDIQLSLFANVDEYNESDELGPDNYEIKKIK